MNALTRRDFLTVSAVAGGGILIGIGGLSPALGATPATPAVNQMPAWIRIAADDSIVIAVPRPEIGQGIATSMTQLLADELDADWSKITHRQAEADPIYGVQSTGGSLGIKEAWIPLRKGGAIARAMLIAAAAQQWKVLADECTTEPSEVVHAASGRRLSYGALAAVAATLTPPQDAPLKPRSAWRYIGKETPKRETPFVVTGKQRYGIDTQLPDMLVATIERVPTLGAIPHYDPAVARTIDGVVDIFEITPDKIRGGVVVVARDTWAAFRGRDALAIQWDEPNADESTSAIDGRLAAGLQQPGKEFAAMGDIGSLRDRHDLVTVQAEYDLPFLAHMPMEPQNFVVQFKDGKASGSGPTQGPAAAVSAIAATLKIDPKNVQFQPTAAGGTYGRHSDGIVEAALIAARTNGRPVKLVWKREDETRFDMYRPTSRARVEVSADKDGNLVGWDHHLACTTTIGGLGDKRSIGRGLLYNVPNGSFRLSEVDSPIRRGSWRGVNYVQNIFSVESAVDELAAALGQDPFALRMKWLMQTPTEKREVPDPFGQSFGRLSFEPSVIDYARMIAVLKKCGETIGWNQRPGPMRGMGVATYCYDKAHCAMAAEVEVNAKGELKVRRIVAAVDVGTIVNPLGLRGQIEGGITMSLSAALHERITIKAGRVQQSTYSDYPLIRMPEVPQIEVAMMESDNPAFGAGEIAMPGVGPAVANAIFAASGRRLRSLPLLEGGFLRGDSA